MEENGVIGDLGVLVMIGRGLEEDNVLVVQNVLGLQLRKLIVVLQIMESGLLGYMARVTKIQGNRKEQEYALEIIA